MSSKYTKEDMVRLAMQKVGCTKKEAVELISELMQNFQATLLEQGSVILSGVGTLNARKQKETEKILFGEKIVVEEKLKLTLNPSRKLNDKFKNKPSKLTTKKLGDLFLNKNK